MKMTNEEFFKLITKTSSRNRIIAIGILIMGIGMIAGGVLSDSPQGTKIAAFVLGGLLAVLGIFMIIKAGQVQSQIKSGQHPLAAAILNHDQSFVLWYYQHTTMAKNVEQTAAHQIWILDRTNKSTIVNVKGKQVQEVFDYLQKNFPAALVGYSDEIKTEYKERLSKS